MTSLNDDDDAQDLSRYKVNSRREIISLLRTVGQRNQLVNMQANHGVDSVVTSILEVDDAQNIVIIDCAPSATTNQRVLASNDLHFETLLENIRILFVASQVESCMHDDRPALRIPLPQSLIRLQRREYYRVPTPVTNPVKCTIRMVDEAGKVSTIAVPLFNVSGGGIAVVDEKKLIPESIGTIFEKCRIDLPGSALEVSLQLRNLHDIKLSNGKQTRRLGFMLINPPNAIMAAIQRYITKLEREQNARATGLS